MKSILSNLFIFAAGAIVGSVVTWKILKKKYEQIAQEDCEPVEEEIVEEPEDENNTSTETPINNKPDLKDYISKLKEEGYFDYGNVDNNEEEEETDTERPYVITPEEFGENDGYERVSLTYYADGYLTDELDNVIEDVDDVVGEDSLGHFGEYEDDSVFVRNDRTKTDYEILLDMRKYADIISKNHIQWRMNDER